MFVWNLLLFAAMLSSGKSSPIPTTDNELTFEVPVEYKDHIYSISKPESDAHSEGNINELLGNLRLKDDTKEEIKRANRSKREQKESMKHNCPVEVKYEQLYKYLDDLYDNKINDDIIDQIPELRKYIKVIKCGVLTPPLNHDGNEQCFKDLLINNYGLKSHCVTVYGRRTVYLVNEVTNKMYRIVLNVPVACNCYVSTT